MPPSCWPGGGTSVVGDRSCGPRHNGDHRFKGAFMFILICSAAAISMAGLGALYLASGWRTSSDRLLLAAPLLLSGALELFDLLSLRIPDSLSLWWPASFVCESLLAPAWLLVGHAMCGPPANARVRYLRRILLGASFLLLPVALFGSGHLTMFSPDFDQERIVFLSRASYLFYLGLGFFLVSALVLLERGLVSHQGLNRWRVKLETVGIGTIVASQFFFYSQALLYRSLDYNLLPVRSAALVLGCGMVVYSRLRRGDPPKIRISRRMTYRSIVILIVGLYLFSLGLAGEGMRYFGNHSQRYFVGLLGLFGGVAVLMLVLSGTHRRRLQVFINKNFFKEKYDYRNHWLDFTRRLASTSSLESVARSALDFYVETFSLHGGAIYLLSNDRNLYQPYVVVDHSLPTETIDVDSPLVHLFREKGWVFNREDGQEDILQVHHDLFRPYRYSFAVPLFVEESIEGIILLGERVDRDEHLNYEDFDLMKTLAVQTMAMLQNYRLGEQLSINRELAAIGKVSAFIMHDLKNLVTNLGLVVENSKDHLHDPEFQRDMIDTLDGTVDRMKGLIGRLQKFGAGQPLNLCLTDLRTLAGEVIAEFAAGGIRFSGESTPVRVDRAEIRKVLLNLLLNAVEASTGEEGIELRVCNEPRPCILVRDRGCGMSEAFMRDRLFRPFETTKDSGFGIGLFQCRQIVEAHGGRIEVESRVGEGTEFRILLPAVTSPAEQVERSPLAEDPYAAADVLNAAPLLKKD
ncbi:hypothetical protein B5V00_00640 [Geothermobacter hydrogeniphilus]|uniref:histidine kinase n=2 Tax=Geothermobacter hydrogeniphilus TaxID=1969733 RepID=A0A1X0YE37_9BACT|nr:hypothetical protein B5V00_00640 [Geothermobacter hydrogeniphilus]